MISYTAAAFTSLAALTAGGCALHRLARHGQPSACLVCAIVAANCLLALLFDPAAHTTRGMVAFLAGWLASSKAVALYCGRGPLVAGRWTAAQFLALYALPMLPAQGGARASCATASSSWENSKAGRSNADGSNASSGSKARSNSRANGSHESSSSKVSSSSSGKASGSNKAGSNKASGSSASTLLAKSAANAALTTVALLGLVAWPPVLVREMLYVLAMYGWLGLNMDGVAAVAHACLGLELQPLFHPPWQAQSIADFWRCWNLAAGSAVRTTVYQPLLEGRWVRLPRRQPGTAGTAGHLGPAPGGGRPALALCLSCLASGIIHEAIVWAITAGSFTPGLAWLAFFSLQGPLILAERWLVGRLGQAGIKLPRMLRSALALGTLLVVAHFLFFKPAERIPTLHAFVARTERAFQALKSMVP